MYDVGGGGRVRRNWMTLDLRVKKLDETRCGYYRLRSRASVFSVKGWPARTSSIKKAPRGFVLWIVSLGPKAPNLLPREDLWYWLSEW